ncbi:Abi-alpha family protein [Avibacterium avium]|uniref:Abi-alpha family protein n=1 Tax=Avibacterium avium TaxID=751 RepID=UPI003BF7F956
MSIGKDIIDTMKPDSSTEIINAQNSTDPNLKIAGELEADSKRKIAEIKNKGITLLYKLIVWNGRKKIQDNISYLSEENKEKLGNKILRIADSDIKLGDIPTIGSATESLIYVQDEPNLKEMFENLIVSTIDKAKKNITHPAFVEILKQFSTEDALHFKSFINIYWEYKPLEIHFLIEKKTLIISIGLNEKITLNLPEIYLENWVRLGIISSNYFVITNNSLLLGGRPAETVDQKKLTIKLTSLGENFAQSVLG